MTLMVRFVAPSAATGKSGKNPCTPPSRRGRELLLPAAVELHGGGRLLALVGLALRAALPAGSHLGLGRGVQGQQLRHAHQLDALALGPSRTRGRAATERS